MTLTRSLFFLLSIVSVTACKSQNVSIEEQLTPASCQPNEPCIYKNKINVWLSEPQLTPETPFDINLSLPANRKIQKARLEGVTMYMGYIPINFDLVGDIYRASTMVGICSEKNMKWKMLLQLQDPKGNVQHITYFFVVRY